MNTSIKTLEHLLALIAKQGDSIEEWFATQWDSLRPLPYFSCDLRHAGHKIAIVDTNLFPGGFNNLCNAFSRETVTAFQNYFATFEPATKSVALVAEAHTRNKFYLTNVFKLQRFLNEAGLDCHVTMPLPAWPKPRVDLNLNATDTLTLLEPQIQGEHLVLDGKKMDLILSNYDFSSGVPGFLPQCKTRVIPPVRLGWHQRSKSRHFQILGQIISGFCRTFNLDPWCFESFSFVVDGITPENMAPLSSAVDDLIRQIRKKYAEYGVTDEPYVFVKNDSGTYGLGVLPVKSGEELEQINRKQREKLFAKKGDNQTSRFFIQEGVPTTDSYSSYPVEPVIYGVGRESVGGFFRFHTEKNNFESLNAPGMDFSCLCLHKMNEPHETQFLQCEEKQNLVTAARFLVRFAALAVAREAM